jgi:hypothetical protein
MSETFLANLMRVAYEITKAERAFAVDPQLNVVSTINVQPEQVDVTYLKTVKQVLENKQPVITDSVTLAIPPDKAPKTNQSFPQLRAVVFIPVNGHGVICVDWRMRTDLLTKQHVEKLMTLVDELVKNHNTGVSEDQIMKLYKQMS